MITPFQKLSAQDKGRCFKPVYVPDETYSFIMNGTPITDPDFDNFVFRLEDATGNIIVADVGELQRVYIEDISYGPGIITPYWIYCIFVFPVVQSGDYCFVIYDPVNEIEKARSGTILCEQDLFETTTLFEFRNSVSRSGYPYNQLIAHDVDFYNIYRLPVTKNEIQFEVDKTQYRNATNRVFRNVVSYLDYGYKLDFIGMTEPALKAVAEMLECDEIQADRTPITPKTNLSEEANPNSVLSNASFETYINQPGLDEEDLAAWGNEVYYGGNPIYNPDIVYDLNDE